MRNGGDTSRKLSKPSGQVFQQRSQATFVQGGRTRVEESGRRYQRPWGRKIETRLGRTLGNNRGIQQGGIQTSKYSKRTPTPSPMERDIFKEILHLSETSHMNSDVESLELRYRIARAHV